ncbi:hypothetical protein [Catalinimonas niigatensis]|uniref:hypothetical protein n=1 Tax=Catalinimonas niigatensis TaxID=1397264 RepID=UPI0026660CF6|nr:hypothetical protein [Catalinimonas niigatensis]WPP51024.1 hypothetical protein PZB72_01275 [Catalinimonas niigatensis]
MKPLRQLSFLQIVFFSSLFFYLTGCATDAKKSENLNENEVIKANPKADGYKGIWFTLNQFTEYGDKYSGGLGTYTAKHIPLSLYAPEVNKTFFVYGGTTGEKERYLLCMIGSYDHTTGMISKPTVVYDKQGVDDPHDNPSLSLDEEGYLWVFVSGRGTSRPGFKFKSKEPYNIDAFERISEEEMTYPQPWHIPGKGFLPSVYQIFRCA